MLVTIKMLDIGNVARRAMATVAVVMMMSVVVVSFFNLMFC
jgi:hypothetical protein